MWPPPAILTAKSFICVIAIINVFMYMWVLQGIHLTYTGILIKNLRILKLKSNLQIKKKRKVKLMDTTAFCFVFPHPRQLNSLWTRKNYLPSPHVIRKLHTQKWSFPPSALPPAIQWHFESKLVSIRSLIWCQQVRYSPQGTKIIVDERAERSPEREIREIKQTQQI